jgi:hypothetical protein
MNSLNTAPPSDSGQIPPQPMNDVPWKPRKVVIVGAGAAGSAFRRTWFARASFTQKLA